ncbi:MAG TPA: chemotaxis protein CheA [Anaeromyxobacteraceae bacterium]|nr:chemotaxis protein CheA [Anaeromyxobacteraceae bacterium]
MADRRSQKAVSEFLSEAQETVETLARELLHLEAARRGEEADPQVLNAVFRGAHSLKGLSSMFGVERMARLSHALEDLLDEVRMGRRPLDGATLDLLLEAPDLLNRILAEEAQGGLPATEAAAEGLSRRLRSAAPAPPAADPPGEYDLGEAVRRVLTEYEEHRLAANARKGVALYRIRAAFELATFDQGLAGLNAGLRPLGEVISTLPSSTPGDPSTIAFEVLLGSKEPASRIRAAAGSGAEVAEVPRRAAAHPAPGGAPPQAAQAPAREAAAAAPQPHPSDAPDPSLRSVSQAVRVDIRKLDALMNAVGELALVKANLYRIAEMARSVGAELGLELHREARALDRRLAELQGGILEVRMVPLSQVFDKLSRMVRKISREVDKAIDFQVSGGEVELDKLIVEELSDPLMHLIRNAIDHGIEPPEVRARAGKPHAGRVALSARQRGNHVQIAVEDDGAGIDEGRVREVALERGLVGAEALREMARRDVLNLVFVPGFSTARQVTALSGRGVGMDVVKNNLAALSGIIELSTETGRGTRFELTLPVTLAIVRALVVKVSGHTYAVPLNSVLEILALEPREIRTIETREVLTLRGATLPLVRLGAFFRLAAVGPSPALAWPPGKVFVVVVGLAQERLGVAVDDIAGQQDIVVKPLGPALEGVRGVAGATDLGNRQTVLVLDVGAVIEDVLRGSPARQAG